MVEMLMILRFGDAKQIDGEKSRKREEKNRTRNVMAHSYFNE